jgi:hypothetical protein
MLVGCKGLDSPEKESSRGMARGRSADCEGDGSVAGKPAVLVTVRGGAYDVGTLVTVGTTPRPGCAASS